MNQVVFGKIEGALCSLQSSTSLAIVANDVGVRLSGRCSTRRSHQGIEFFRPRGDRKFGGVLLDNGKRRLGVGRVDPAWLEAPALQVGEVKTALLPRAFIYPFLEILGKYFPEYQLAPGPLVEVLIHIPTPQGWDENRKPIFEDRPEKGVDAALETVPVIPVHLEGLED